MITAAQVTHPTAIDRDAISRLVYRFYDEVRADALLGPAFEAVLADRWATHLPRMVEFWSTLVLSTRSFSGNVFAKHMALAGITPAHVRRWLRLWQRDTALEGLETLRATVERARGRLGVMACGGLDAGNIAHVRDATGAPELHFAALRTEPSGMRHRNPRVGMGGTSPEREYTSTVTDESAVRATIAAARC